MRELATGEKSSGLVESLNAVVRSLYAEASHPVLMILSVLEAFLIILFTLFYFL